MDTGAYILGLGSGKENGNYHAIAGLGFEVGVGFWAEGLGFEFFTLKRWYGGLRLT